jgi:hypothetical protein
MTFAQSQAPGDEWLTQPGRFPADAQTVRSNHFADLRAEGLAGKLHILWAPQRFISNSIVTVHASADEPGHWPARDWRSYPMIPSGQKWQASVPVDDVDVPLIYFVSTTERASNAGGILSAVPLSTNLSPMRICRPRAAGLPEPTRIFWPFIEGFEEDTESWQWLAGTPDSRPLRTDSTARQGLAALLVSLPAKKRSVTVGTTRLRGWQLQRQGATGLRLWLRTRQGAGLARFTLLANAFSPDQVVALYPKEMSLTNQWQKMDVLFGQMSQLPLGAVDLFTIEFIGEGPRDFLVDDLQLLGPWRQ